MNMKKSLIHLCAVLLISIFCMGCAGSSVSGQNSAISSSASQPGNADSEYFILVGNLLVGSYKNGQWHSAENNPIYIADLLGQKAYYCYDQTESMGVSKKLTFCYEQSLSNSFDGDGTPFIPYAEEHDEQSQRISFNLPFELPEDLRTVKSQTYNTNIYFDIQFPSGEEHVIPLILSADFDPLPKSEVKELTGTFSGEDKAAVKAELQRLGVPGAPVNITETYEFDIEGDGTKEQFIFAETPKDDENGWPNVSEEEITNDQSGYYYVVLCKDETGYSTVVSWCWPYEFSTRKPDIQPGIYYCDAIRSVHLEGIFDLNNDGTFELCLLQPEYESGQMFVYALNEHNTWDRVLTGSCGM